MQTTTMEWNSERYAKQYKICSKLSDKGLLIALNQAAGMTPEAREAYCDVLRERGWSDSAINLKVFGTLSRPEVAQ